MLRPKTFLGPVMVFLVPAAVWSTLRPSLAEPAVEECKSKPDAPSPAGSHWYYRINRPDGRHCWYLGPQDRTKARSAVPESVSRTSLAAPKTQRPAAADIKGPRTDEATVAEASPAATSSLQVAPAQTAASRPSLGPTGEPSAQTQVAVRWPDPPFPPAIGVHEPGSTNTSYAKEAAAVDVLDAPSAAIPEPASVRGSNGPGPVRLSATAITSTLALALFLATVILKFARRTHEWEAWFRDYWEFSLRFGFTSWCRKLAAAFLEMTASKLRTESAHHDSAPQTVMRADSPHDFKAGLQQLMRDLRRAEAATEAPQKFEPSARHQLRVLLGKGSPQAAALAGESRSRDLSPTERFLQRRSAVGLV
jgi:hypothetical protein